MINKKGMALENLAFLIIAAISFGLILSILLSSGLMTNLQSTVAVALTTFQSNFRGQIVQLIWFLFGVITIMMGFVMLLGSTCKQLPWGAAICGVAFAIVMGILFFSIMNIQSKLPWVDFTTSAIEMPIGVNPDDCGRTKGVAPELFMKEMADRTVDCWIMYAQGKYDPLAGKVPPNPRTCFIIKYNIAEGKVNGATQNGVRFSDVRKWMVDNTYYDEEISYWNKVKQSVLVENARTIDDVNDYYFKSGTIYVKYADAIYVPSPPSGNFEFTIWESPDCNIGQLYYAYNDKIHWCIEEEDTRVAPAYGNGCDKITDVGW